ncbi:helix-turn-helix domain-containing protein [Nonomuraea insulae]|uniref:Helix-turn-helix domain-containing protein n=1 Tax=Nonomuraea insulae TaxID=1616787 RepID=A0ABW1CMJ4_9ACTN
MTTFGEKTQELMSQQGFSLRKLAKAANYDVGYLSKIVNDHKPPSVPLAQRLESVLGVDGELMELVPVLPDVTEDVIDILRRVHKLNRSVDPAIICQMRDTLGNAVTGYEQASHSHLAPMLCKQRAWIDELIQDCNDPAQRQQLFEIAGGTSGVLGYIATGLGNFPLARAYCAEAFQLATLAQTANLQAWARGMQSFCEYYAHDYDEALRLAVDGLTHAESQPQSVRLTLNGVARALGKLGDVEGVHSAVASAYDLLSCNQVPSGVPSSISLGCYSAAQAASNAATAYLSLGMPDKVRQYVTLALPDIDSSESPWSRSLIMIDYAASLVPSEDADVEHISSLALDALSISAGRPIISVQQRAIELVRQASQRWPTADQLGQVRHAISEWGAR